jgi:hypothetical protein
MWVVHAGDKGPIHSATLSSKMGIGPDSTPGGLLCAPGVSGLLPSPFFPLTYDHVKLGHSSVSSTLTWHGTHMQRVYVDKQEL